ncbi:glycosyltransferase involved in cell wall biosynthesis [Anaerospora hongkongensis]|uniref:Glycosyltransferase involved in cell wall biosynthesis n=1 Tax=Anaerospora hongkongensis TaxID=244830 RepID=A0A4R1PV69_9FIRM|nr:glycosyltransferase family 4 protein [Anaerospora hongkongensis]TCL36069.1 glycosyltransferase involved in cell wall biosynthesis [Anaerospora hongkongensis]
MNIVITAFANGSDHQRYATIVANYLSLKHNVLLICTSNFDISQLNDNIQVNNLIICDKSRIELSTLQLNIWVKIYSDIISFKPKIIHFFCAHPLNLFLSLFYKTKKVYTIHDVKPHPDENVSCLISIYNNIIKFIAYRIIVHSKLAKRQLGRFGNKAVVLPLCGTEILKLEPYTENQKILFYGRIKPYKGLDLFINAAEKLIIEIPNSKFVIAGQGDVKKYLSLIKNKENFEIYNDYISNNETDRLFKECKLIVLPYYSATQSGVIPLAYSYNRPIVATNVGAISEMVLDKKTGILVEPDINQISNAIKILITNDELYRKLCENISEEFSKNYSETNMGQKFRRFYESIV